MSELAMGREDFDAFFAEEFPEAVGRLPVIEALGAEGVRVRLPFQERFVRPGGTLSGPTMMRLADHVAYILVLSRIGPVALAVTTSLNINFLSKPAPRDLIAEGALLKLGKRLAVSEVRMRTEGSPAIVAHATVTYSIPPQ